MSALLDQAIAEARKLSPEDQDAIAALILEEIDDDREWEALLAKNPSKLEALAARAKAQVAAGQSRVAGFGEL
jgi:hypothetical protein